MKNLISIIFFAFILLFASCNNTKQEEKASIESETKTHRILSCNIRVALPQDSLKGVGWDKRKEACLEVIKNQNADIICAQEVLKVQYEDMCEALSGYDSFGFIGPDMDAFPEGYHGIAKNVIFYSKKRYELRSQGNYWLSETPHIAASMSWGSARARHCNWVRLYDKYTGKEFRVLNTHLDHIAQEAKEAQINMILNEAKQYQETFPQLLIGDFNANMDNNVIKSISLAGWTDIFAKLNPDRANARSYHGFKGMHDDSGDSGRIDFIFSYGPVEAIASRLITDEVNGMFPSDHFFLSSDVELN